METRLTLRPGRPGTKKLVARFGARLVCVRYRYDAATSRRYTTVELIIDEIAWTPRPRKRRDPRDDDLAVLRIRYNDIALRNRISAAGGKWNPVNRSWELRWADAHRHKFAEHIIGRIRAADRRAVPTRRAAAVNKAPSP